MLTGGAFRFPLSRGENEEGLFGHENVETEPPPHPGSPAVPRRFKVEMT